MATTQEFIEYVCEQIQGVGNTRYKKMFGEYMVYVNDKPLLLVCDNTVYIKKIECMDPFMQEASLGHPYNGAKEHYILDIDNRALSIEVVETLETAIPVPKTRAKKQVNSTNKI